MRPKKWLLPLALLACAGSSATYLMRGPEWLRLLLIVSALALMLTLVAAENEWFKRDRHK